MQQDWSPILAFIRNDSKDLITEIINLSERLSDTLQISAGIFNPNPYLTTYYILFLRTNFLRYVIAGTQYIYRGLLDELTLLRGHLGYQKHGALRRSLSPSLCLLYNHFLYCK